MALNYQIALTNVVFDNTYTNVLRFDNRADQETYFGVGALFDNAPAVNFNVGSLLNTTITYDCKPNESVNEMLNKNYCIVKDNSPSKTLNYYYYFVTSANQECGNRIQLAIELDVIQTYYLNINFNDCLIERAHLNRFVPVDNQTVRFDCKPTSKLFERDTVRDLPKRLVQRKRVYEYDENASDLKKWIDENVIAWMYIYVQPHHNFKCFNPSTDNVQELILGDTKIMPALIPLNMTVLTIPLCLFGSIRFKIGNKNYYWGGGFPYVNSVLNGFRDLNDEYAFVYSIKISDISPLNLNRFTGNYTFEQVGSSLTDLVIDTEYITVSGNSKMGIKNPLTYTTTNENYAIDFSLAIFNENGQVTQFGPRTCMTYLDYGGYNKTFDPVQLNKEFIFNKSDIINSNNNKKYNPKLLSNDFLEINITDHKGASFTYDLQKLGSNEIQLRHTEALTPDFTRKYIRIVPTEDQQENGLYVRATANNLTGLVSNNDDTLILPTSQYATMIANNKNFYVQNESNRTITATNQAFDVLGKSVKSIGSIDPADLYGAMTSGINLALQYEQSVINENFTTDNLRNAPAQIKAAQGSAIFSAMYTDPGVYLEIYEALDNDLEKINDYMNLYGFSYNRIDNIKNYDNVRAYHNYIKAYVEELRGDNVLLSNQVRQKIRQIFLNGVRFWNNDKFVYGKENYERWLENE